ncbi:DNA-binding protein YbaB [Actinoalloteichus hoggarensis]|uniref:Uncharacterized protein n=1 Tax=Actinoalloteichus hoggarensis TaxID=1470176 RepID=A0A221W6X9_9PSEU|nr:YbaB/EbfC family nucleoid-associated protein [Actinoalloteichus hoggarensis]ASO21504.1 hypothetical protein AHOG_19410 [Actinoalloteichus hoggarensis]MBB5922093.1 DNA-binding protein YbaB [Actinoalloteichus hoggarensis]
MASREELEERLARSRQRYRRAREKASLLTETTIVEDVDGGLGTVAVRGHGQLLRVSLDPSALRYATGRSVSTAVLRSIQRAEARARALRESRDGTEEGHSR